MTRRNFLTAAAIGFAIAAFAPGRAGAQSGYTTSVVVQVRRPNQALVGGAAVELRDGTGRRTLSRATSDSSGVATFKNVGAGQYTAYASHRSYGSGLTAAFSVQSGGGVVRPRVYLAR